MAYPGRELDALLRVPRLARARLRSPEKISSSSRQGCELLVASIVKRIKRAFTGSKVSMLRLAFTGGPMAGRGSLSPFCPGNWKTTRPAVIAVPMLPPRSSTAEAGSS